LPGRFVTIIAPLLRIVPNPAAIDLVGAQALVFTSANGVEQFATASSDRALPAYCVGAMTAEVALHAGFHVVSADGDAAKLAALVIAAHRPGHGDILHVRGRHAAGDLVGRLAAAGVPARSLELYDQEPEHITGQAKHMLDSKRITAVALFSPRSAALFAKNANAEGWELGTIAAVSLSSAVDLALGEVGAGRRIIASTPTRDGMLAALAAV
jgi:uroporphyrinogen-III synthase